MFFYIQESSHNILLVLNFPEKLFEAALMNAFLTHIQYNLGT